MDRALQAIITRYVEEVDRQVLAIGRRVGWKKKKGTVMVPEDVVIELLRSAYESGFLMGQKVESDR